MFITTQEFVPVTEQPVAKNFSINNMVMEERMRQGQPPPWHEQDEIDSTRVSKTVLLLLLLLFVPNVNIMQKWKLANWLSDFTVYTCPD